MLVLTRRESEVLHIGDNVTVTVLGIKGNQVRIGITAPRDVNVVREELLKPEDLAANGHASRAIYRNSSIAKRGLLAGNTEVSKSEK